MLVLYVLTLLLTASLLFLVEPLVAKTLLPPLGGGPVVWTTCAAFFQVALLIGYGYAHFALRRLALRRQVAVHLLLLVAALFTLPLGDASGWAVPAANQELWLFGKLALLVGLPFVLLSASAPLLQRWLAGSDHRDARDPYFLYAASNVGSLVALLSYPLLVEPTLGLGRQRHWWSWGFAAAIFLVAACGLVVRRGVTGGSAIASTDTAPDATDQPTWRQRLRWFVLAMVPASLMLSVTSYASTDLAALPLLWVVPLALYLLTFVIAFARRGPRMFTPARVLRWQPFFLIPLAIEFFWTLQGAAWPVIPFHILAFTVSALVCHQALAASRPPASRLTTFYLWISLGGAAGGLFNVLVAPQLFSTVLEYPLGIVAVALLRPRAPDAPPLRWRHDATLALGLFAALGSVALLLTSAPARDVGVSTSLIVIGVALGGAGVLALGARERPLRFGLVVAAIVAAGLIHTRRAMPTLFNARSFFGVHAVRDDGHRRILSQGNTNHGFQDLRPERRRQATSYFHRTGPLGQIMEGWKGTPVRQRVAIVGLGTGTLATYADPGERWTYYEIDPVVIDIARDRGLYTFLADARGAIDIVLGDARLSLAATPDAEFGIIVVDAFTSDAIPAHLLTREALALYDRKLKKHGLIVFHISNRYVDLRQVVGHSADALGYLALVCDGSASPEEAREGKTSSRYMVAARSDADLVNLPAQARCQPLTSEPPSEQLAPWTDDRWSLWPVLRFRWKI